MASNRAITCSAMSDKSSMGSCAGVAGGCFAGSSEAASFGCVGAAGLTGDGGSGSIEEEAEYFRKPLAALLILSMAECGTTNLQPPIKTNDRPVLIVFVSRSIVDDASMLKCGIPSNTT